MNKKYAVFGVAAVIAVAGVIYFGTGAGQQASVANVASKYSIPTPIDEPTIPTPPMTEFQWRKLCRDKQPHIQVLSPNGGEMYQAGQQITVKWRSCNISGAIAEINLTSARDNGWGPGSGPNAGKYTFVTNTLNDGHELVTLPDNNSFATYGASFGKYFKAEVNASSANDSSNNLFTINASIDPWTTTCSDGQPHIQVLSPNGGETYTQGQQMTVQWKVCNYSQPFVNVFLEVPGIHLAVSGNAGIPFGNGSTTITIPTRASWALAHPNDPALPLGNVYKVWIDNNGNAEPYPANNNFGDFSDNFFKVN